MRFDTKRHGWIVFLAFLCVCLIVLKIVDSGVIGSDGSLTDVIVSEIAPKNSSLMTPAGICDYIELYNPTDKTINLSGVGVSDNTESVGGAIPGGTRLKPGETYLIALGQGSFPFSLKNGEVLTLFYRDNTPFFTFPIKGAGKDTVYAYDNGTYVITDRPSPGFPNTEEGIKAYNESLVAESDIKINEICMESMSLTEMGDWVELINTSDSVCRYPEMYLSDLRTNLFQIRIPAGSLKPGEVLLVQLGDASLGRTFGLKEGETVYLSFANGKIADSLKVLSAPLDISQGREGLLPYPTPGYENTESGYKEFLSTRTYGLVISEVMSWNNSYLPGPYATTHSYIELYNAGEESVDLSGYYISDGADGMKYPVGEGELAPGECMVLFAEKNATRVLRGYAVADFNISSSGDGLVLWHGDKSIDTVNVPKLGADQAYGRRADMTFGFLDVPSPEKRNW